MIYILAGKDHKERNKYIQNLHIEGSAIRIPDSDVSKEVVLNYATGLNLFGEASCVIIDGLIGETELNFTEDELKVLQDSKNTFILLEEKILAATEKKYKKFAKIIHFEEKKVTAAPRINTFAIADAFGACDKVKAWILYREAIDAGIEPEPISGILFWKIKTMLLNGTRTFTKDILKKQSSELVSLYHLAHRGEIDFIIGLEQFILSSLSK